VELLRWQFTRPSEPCPPVEPVGGIGERVIDAGAAARFSQVAGDGHLPIGAQGRVLWRERLQESRRYGQHGGCAAVLEAVFDSRVAVTCTARGRR
jgi:hypothetical protein